MQNEQRESDTIVTPMIQLQNSDFFFLKSSILDFINFRQKIHHVQKLRRAINSELKHLNILFILEAKKIVLKFLTERFAKSQ